MTDVAVKQENLPAELAGLGLEEITHTTVTRKYITLDNHSGNVMVSKTDTVLADSKKQVKMTPIFTYEMWQYVTPDGSQVLKQDLIHEKHHNLALQDNENVVIEDRGGVSQPVTRTKARVIMALIQDHELEGPMFLTLRRQKLWTAQTSILSKWLENKAKKIPIFGQQFLLSSEQKTNKKNQKYYVYKFIPADLVPVDAQMKLAGMYKELRDSQDRLLQQSDDESGNAGE